jgi:hypothetical protein
MILKYQRDGKDPNLHRKKRFQKVATIRDMFADGIYFSEKMLNRHLGDLLPSATDIEQFIRLHTFPIQDNIQKNDTHYFIMDNTYDEDDGSLRGYWLRMDNVHIPSLRITEQLIRRRLQEIRGSLSMVLTEEELLRLDLYLRPILF